MEMMNIKIFVAHHKPGFVYEDDIFIPIHVGSKLSNKSLNILRDDSGDNISELNPFYCEMTAVYWAWKNSQDLDYIGLCHYRRYLINKNYTKTSVSKIKFNIHKIIGKLDKSYKKGISPNQIIYSDVEELNKDLVNTSKTIKNLIEKGVKLIIPNKFEYANMSNRDHFNIIGKHYIDKLLEIIHSKHPLFYSTIDKTLKDKFIYSANIFIMDKKNYNDYCTLMFDILDEHIQFYKNDLEFNKSYSRISGYLAELITNAYINKLISEGIMYKELGHAFLNI